MTWACVWERPEGGVRAIPAPEMIRLNREAFRSGLEHSLSPLALAESMEDALLTGRELKRARRERKGETGDCRPETADRRPEKSGG